MLKHKKQITYYTATILFMIVLVVVNIFHSFSMAENDELLNNMVNQVQDNAAGELENLPENDEDSNGGENNEDENNIENDEDEENGEEEATPFAIFVGFEEGDGTSANPYKISTKDDLDMLAYVVNNGTADTDNGGYYYSKYYELTDDIDYRGEEFIPIGKPDSVLSNYTSYTFQGVFNGNGHTIKNLVIVPRPGNVNKEKYGLFAALYSSSTSEKAMICNLEIDNMNIRMVETMTITKDLVIGGIVGDICLNSEVKNCIIKNSSIYLGPQISHYNEIELSIGGIVGDATANPTTNNSIAAIPENQACKIENCYSDVDITVCDQDWTSAGTTTRYYQYVIGGIIGRIRSHPTLPSNCVYTGTISARNAFIAPIYANSRYDAVTKNRADFLKVYLALKTNGEPVTTMVGGKFFDYKIITTEEHIIGSNFKNELTETRYNQNYVAYTLGSTGMSIVQGVNAGECIQSATEACGLFNLDINIGSTYNRWYYDEYERNLTFKEQDENAVRVNIIKNATHSYTAVLMNNNNNEVYQYKWYVDYVEQAETSNSIVVTYGDIRTLRALSVCVMKNGESVTSKSIMIEEEELEAKIELDESKTTNELYVNIIASFEISPNDYTYEWYRKNQDTQAYELVATTAKYEIPSDIVDGDEFKVIATHNSNSTYNIEAIRVMSNVVYVNYSKTVIGANTYAEGNDANYGRTPETAVKTLARAYDILLNNVSAEENIIVLMGDYKEVAILPFNKPATVTSVYGGIDYQGGTNGGLYLKKEIFLQAKTIFKNVSLHCDVYDIFLYCQGNDLTMDENVNIICTAKPSLGWGLASDNYSCLCIFGGWLNYRYSDVIPDRTTEIVIKSGCYARISGGSRTVNDNVPADKSPYFASLENPFNVHITIDIENDEQNKGTYEKSIGLLIGGQVDGSSYSNNKIDVLNGSIGRLYGGSLGVVREYTNCPANTFFGSTELNLKGGYIGELFGGCYGRDVGNAYFYGKIKINATGSTIGDSIYGAGAGGVAGYSTDSSDTYKSWAFEKTMIDMDGNPFRLDKTTVEVNISDTAEILGHVYGGGYGYSIALSENQIARDGGGLYGDVTVNVTGGKIHGNVYGGGKGTNKYSTAKPNLARVTGNVTVNVTGTPIIKGSIYGGSEGEDGYVGMGVITGNVTVNVHDIQIGNTVVTDVYGGGKGTCANVDGTTTVNITNVQAKGSIYGGGDAADVLGDTHVNIVNSRVIVTTYKPEKEEGAVEEPEEIECGGQVYGGGRGEDSIVYGTTHVDIDNTYIEVRVCGGGDKGTVITGTDVYVHGGSNVEKAVYGGGNEADIGTEENFNNGIFANTIVLVEDAIIGLNTGNLELQEEIYGAGEVFGGGNFGVVYGDTQARVGSLDPYVETNIKSVFYAGGRGIAGETTVKGNSNAYIRGVNTKLNSYGNTALGGVDGTVNITFNTFKGINANSKYAHMSGINAATNIYLKKSYVYLTSGLKNIENLHVPDGSGIMISKNSRLSGNFFGGGNLYLQNEVCLTICGNLYDSDSSDTQTKLTLNPALLDDQCYVIHGNKHTPYVRVLGEDYSSGIGFVSGDRKKYTMYSLHKDHEDDSRYISSSTMFASKNIYDANNREIYENIEDLEDDDDYYYDDEINKFYIITNDLELNELVYEEDEEGGSIQEEDVDSIYYIEKRIIIASYATLESTIQEDRVYYSNVANENHVYITNNGSFTSDINITYTMIRNVEEDKFLDENALKNVTRSVHIESTGEVQEFPVNTKITMISNGNYYIYKVKNSGIEAINLEDFCSEDNPNIKYTENANIRDEVHLIDENIPMIWEFDEDYRFIVDFSECSEGLEDSMYDFVCTLNEKTVSEENEDEFDLDEIYTDLSTNSVYIESRNYDINFVKDKESYISSDVINISGTLNLDRISELNNSDIGRDIVAFINLKKDGEYINLPVGTMLTINDVQYDITENMSVVILEDLKRNAYRKDLDIKIDMGGVIEHYQLDNGEYTLDIDFYLSVNDSILSATPALSRSIDLSISKPTGYGIKILSVNKAAGERDDQAQLVTTAGDVTKVVNIQYKNGNLSDGTHIVAKTYKREADGVFNYIDAGTNIVQNNDITVNGDTDITSNLLFDSNLENGTYKIVYQILDINNNEVTRTHINFIVKR